MDQTLRRVAVIGGVRIPFCRSNTLYADKSNLEMLIGVLDGMIDKYKLKGVHIDEVIGGAVVTHSRDWNLAREAVLGTKPGADHARHHHPAGLRHQPAGGLHDPGQDRHRRDRVRHCHGLRHDLGCADRVQGRSSRIVWSRRRMPSRWGSGFPHSRASRRRSWPRSRPASPSRAPASPWASTPS